VTGAPTVEPRKPLQAKTQTVNVAGDSERRTSRWTGHRLSIRATTAERAGRSGRFGDAYRGGGGSRFGSVSLDFEPQGEITSLAPRVYAFYVFSNGYSPALLPVRPGPRPPTLPVQLTPGGRVEVRPSVRSRSDPWTPREPVICSALPPGRPGSTRAPVTVWDNFTPGSYQLFAPGPTAKRPNPSPPPKTDHDRDAVTPSLAF